MNRLQITAIVEDEVAVSQHMVSDPPIL